jgi:hypothetical protein
MMKIVLLFKAAHKRECPLVEAPTAALSMCDAGGPCAGTLALREISYWGSVFHCWTAIMGT